MALLSKARKPPKIGLALGGGAARGIAHLGVLKVFAEEDVPIHALAGTSAGSLVGALYCSGYRWQDIFEIVKKTRWKDMVKPVFPRMGLVKAGRLEKKLGELIGDIRIEDMPIPFRAVSVDLLSGQEVVHDRGSAAAAVRASCSVPGIFEPARMDDRLLIDGGMKNSVPARICRTMGCDVVVAIDLNADRVEHHEPTSIFSVIYHSFAILFSANSKEAEEYADVVVRPDLDGFSYANLKRADELVERGETAMREAIARVKAKIAACRGARSA